MRSSHQAAIAKDNEMILSGNFMVQQKQLLSPPPSTYNHQLNSSDILNMEVIFENSNLGNLTVPQQTNISTGAIITLPPDIERVTMLGGTQMGPVDMEIDHECSSSTSSMIVNPLTYKIEQQSVLHYDENEMENYEEHSEMGLYDDDTILSIKTKELNDDEDSGPHEEPIEQMDEFSCKYLTEEVEENEEEEEEEVMEEEEGDGEGDTLEVVARQDPLDSGKLIYEVFQVCGRTGKKSDEPIDLPPDVIERIKSELQNSNG